MNLDTWTPDQTALATPTAIDERLQVATRALTRATHARDTAHRRVEFFQRQSNNPHITWRPEYDGESGQHVKARDDAQEQITALEAIIDDLTAEYERRPWPRAWLADSATNSSVHSGLDCPRRSRPPGSTIIQVELVPALSGLNEAQVVDEAGERSCTLCYAVPADKLRQTTRVYSDAERIWQAERAERVMKARRDALRRAAKAITAPDGSALRTPYGEVLATVAAVERAYVQIVADLETTSSEVEATYPVNWRDRLTTTARRLLEALAHKRSWTIEATRERLAAKVARQVAEERGDIERIVDLMAIGRR